MRCVRHIVLAAAVSLICTTGVSAQKVKIVGLGASSCANFRKDVETNPQVQRDYFAWAQGYMSGVLIRAPAGVDEDVDLNPSAFPLLKQVEFLRAYCTGEQNADYVDGVHALYRMLKGKQI